MSTATRKKGQAAEVAPAPVGTAQAEELNLAGEHGPGGIDRQQGRRAAACRAANW